MWGIRIIGDLFTTYGKFSDLSKALIFARAEFGTLVAWEPVRVNY